MRNAVQLITYADRLGGSIAGLREVLTGPLAGLFGGVHVLPFFRPYDGADAGFDPIDHTEVDPRLGTWADVRELGQELETVVDVIVNHVSSGAPEFLDWLARGDAAPSAGMFLTLASVFPDGATEDALLRIYRPRPGLPFTPYVFAGRTRRLVWTTFTSQQVDLDVNAPQAQDYLDRVLRRLAEAGVSMIRLDAVGYAVKTRGTSCFMTPETFEFIGELTERARSLGLDVLVEVHSYYQRQIEIGARVDRVYDFALPPLVLHALTTADPAPLQHWLEIRPQNAVTVLDTHDGIGVIDVGADSADPQLLGLLGPEQIDGLVTSIHERSGGTSRLATGATASNVDIYQVNCTFYEALGRDDGRYLLARALQFFTPGIPQVYYVGLLAGTNDVDRLEATGVGREINRHAYPAEELTEAVAQPVVQALFRLIRFRNAHPAFGGTFSSSAGGGGTLLMRWQHGDDEAVLEADLAEGTYAISWTAAGGRHTVSDAADLPS